MEKILVTGGAGFIGSHVLDELLKKGYAVRVLDSFVSGKRDRIPEGVEVIEGDVRDIAVLTEAMKGVAKVVHLAALVSVAASMEEPLETHDVNVTGTANVFETARKNGIARIVYASSAAVYGDEPTLPKREDTALAPKSPYALSKFLDEEIAEAYQRIYDFSSAGLRFFNVYGKRQEGDHPYASVIPKWLVAAKKGETCRVFGDGSQTRDFIEVRDVARAVVTALESTAGGVFNIAAGTETKLSELQELLATGLEGKISFENVPAREGDIARSVADVSRAKKELGFEAAIPLSEGVMALCV